MAREKDMGNLCLMYGKIAWAMVAGAGVERASRPFSGEGWRAGLVI